VRRVLWYSLIIAITLAALMLLWQFSVSIILFALSLAVSAAVKPLINDIAQRVRSRRVALGIVYALVIASILGLFFVVGQLILQDLKQATDDFAVTYDHIKTDWPNHGTVFQKAVAEQLPDSNDLYKALTSEQSLLSLTQTGGPGRNFFTLLGYVALIMSLSVYWSNDQLRAERITVSIFPAEHRPKVLQIWRSIESGVGVYLRSETAQSVLTGLLLGVGYWGLGLRYPALLAVWGALARLIPWFGALIAIIPLIIVGGVWPFPAVIAILYTIVVLFLLRIGIGRRFMDRPQYDNPLLIALFVTILAAAFGVMGVLLSPPLAVAVQILLQELSPLIPRRYSEELDQAFRLKRRLSHVRSSLKSPGSTEAVQVVNRLNQLVRQTITYMQRY
jgi:predicted PurR-regulated permease PerM